MDNYGRPTGFSLIGFILNILTIGVLLVTLCVGAAFVAVFVNPSLVGWVNPFLPVQLVPPPTLPPTLGPPTATNTPEIPLPPTWTATPTITDTPTPTATATPAPTDTPASTAGTAVPSPTPSPTGAPFALQSGSPSLTQNFANTKGCQWMGVAGQAFDYKNNAPITGLAVILGGQLGGTPIFLTSLTGSAPAYGLGGYEFFLSDHPIASKNTLWIQLKDTAGVALSDRINFSTSDKCNQNLVLINWIQVR